MNVYSGFNLFISDAAIMLRIVSIDAQGFSEQTDLSLALA